MTTSGRTKKANHIPNTATKKAMNELKAGKGKKFNSVKELFESI